MIQRVIPALPIVGIALALILYFCAASRYSAATTLDPTRGGYHHLHDYWCTLYAPVTYTGQTNTGRPWAMAATLALVGTICFFWFSVTRLFAERRLLCLAIRGAGAVSVIFGALIFTPLHNMVITLAAPLGFAAIVATCIGLALARERQLLTLALLAVGAGLADYLAWMLKIWVDYQPMIQKAAFALVLLWILATALKVLLLPAINARSARSSRHLPGNHPLKHQP